MKKSKKSPKKSGINSKGLLQQTGLAMKNEFYLEASWMLSNIIERKLKKMVEKIEDLSPGNGVSLEQSIKRIKHLHTAGKDQNFSSVFQVSLIDEIRTWKNQRNTILKDMLEVHVSQARLERLAEEGIRLLKEWNASNKKYKSAGTGSTIGGVSPYY